MPYLLRPLIGFIAAALILVLAASGCRVKNIESSSSATLVSIAVTPANPSMAPGTTLQLQAVGVYSNNARLDLTTFVTWDSSDAGVATVSSTGLASSVNAGSSTVTATFSGITGSTVLTTSPLVSIAVTPADQSIAPGTTLQLAALGTLLNGATQNLTSFVTWDSSSAVVSITAAGFASALSAGDSTITATFDGITGSTTLTVAAVTSIVVTPTNVTIASGTTQQFTATGTLADGATQNLTTFATWSSSDTEIATIGISTGLANAVAQGSATITASFSTITGTATLMVTAPALVSISVTPTSATIAKGANQQFTARGTYSDGSHQDLTSQPQIVWTSSNTSVAAIDTAGLASSAGIGTTTITAKLSGITSNAATLTVTAPALISIAVTPTSAAVPVGFTQQFIATGTYSDGSTKDLTTLATWGSSTFVATISNLPGFQGKATPFNAGTTNITATFSGITSNTALLTVPF